MVNYTLVKQVGTNNFSRLYYTNLTKTLGVFLCVVIAKPMRMGLVTLNDP